MAYELYDWQEAHASKLAFALKAHGNAFDASDMGTGKTIIACKVARELGLLPIVICPKSVIPNWRNVIRDVYEYRHNEEQALVYNYEKITRTDSNLSILSRGASKGSFRWRLDNRKCLLIFDEVHRCKGDKTLNGKLLYSAVDQQMKVLMLSATACQDPREMKSIGYALGLHGYKDFWTWCLKHGCRKGWFGGLDFKNPEPTLTHLHDEIFGWSGRGSRIRIKDLPEGSFPENMIICESYQVQTPKNAYIHDFNISRALARVRHPHMFEYDPEEDEEENPLTQLLRLRQDAELLKVPALVELASQAYSEGKSPVIFVNFKETLQRVLDLLSKTMVADDSIPDSIFTITGGQSDEEREYNVNHFQKSKKSIMVAMIQAGGVGLSLHDEHGHSPRVSIISPGFSAVELKQALGRIYRAGSQSKALQYVVFADGTVEEHVLNSVRKKLNNLDLLNDGDLQDPFLLEYENTAKLYESISVPDYVFETEDDSTTAHST